MNTPVTDPVHQPPRPARIIGAMWLYSLLRILLFLVLFGVLWLIGVRGLLGAFVAAVISIPLSFVLLARPRQFFAARVEQNLRQKADSRERRVAELEPRDEP